MYQVNLGDIAPSSSWAAAGNSDEEADLQSAGVNAASSSLARRQRQFFQPIRELVKETMTEYMHVSTASTMTKIVECTGARFN